LNVIINIIPKIKTIQPDFTKSQKWVNKKVNELKVILDSYKSMIDTLNKLKKSKKQEDNDLEKLKEIVDEPVVEKPIEPIDEPIEPIIEKPVVQLTSMDDINELIKLWNKQTELKCKKYANEVDLHSWKFELETATQELHFIQKKIDLLNKKISNGIDVDGDYTYELKIVNEEIEKLK
jgi:chromosome segregation ATPase